MEARIWKIWNLNLLLIVFFTLEYFSQLLFFEFQKFLLQ